MKPLLGKGKEKAVDGYDVIILSDLVFNHSQVSRINASDRDTG